VGGFGVVDAITWPALGLALTIVGLLVSAVVWRRRGPTPGIRAVAWSLLPLAAGLTGVLQLLWRIGSLVAGWAVHVILSPVVWLGIAVAGLAVVLFGTTGVLRAKGVGRRARSKSKAVEPKPSTTLGSGKGAAPARHGDLAGETDGDTDDDMADVEAILKRHGIS
jgi:hypothetical protein